ncbi:hypothetical protein [Aestuariivirga sp.]|uniref:hypothetical protein n=1 Tax=Aestuariivirga sp. TaxID=2650926 RepID=UPI003592FB46
MKALRILLTAALLVASPVAMAIHGSAQVSEIDGQMAVSAIMSAGTRASLVANVTHVPSVGVIRLSVRGMRGAETHMLTPEDFKILARKYTGGIARLQRSLAANPVTREALDRRNIAIGRVWGVQVGSNGALRLYIY